jgi:hypothetical protein
VIFNIYFLNEKRKVVETFFQCEKCEIHFSDHERTFQCRMKQGIYGFIAPDYIVIFEMKVKTYANLPFSILTLNYQSYFGKCLV